MLRQKMQFVHAIENLQLIVQPVKGLLDLVLYGKEENRKFPISKNKHPVMWFAN